MASIMGFQMKNIKGTRGIEGPGCTASLYLNGKRIGTYANYGDGAMGNASYLSKEAEEAMTKVILAYGEKHPNEFIVELYKKAPKKFKRDCEAFQKYHPYVSDLTVEAMSANIIDYIAEAFLQLRDAERWFKKWQKKGYRTICVNGNEITAFPESWSDEQIEAKTKGEGILYTSLEDFVQ